MNFNAYFFIKITTLFIVITRDICTGLIFNPTSLLSATTNPSIPQYRFHYYVRDEKTGDYKAHEERRNGDAVTGAYMVGEPNGDLRVVKYAADSTNGFKADVNVQPGGSPLRSTTPPPQMIIPTDGIIGYNNHRTGISPPPKYHRKPQRGFNPIVVKSMPAVFQQPIFFATRSVNATAPLVQPYHHQRYNDVQNISSSEFAATFGQKKSVQVDLTYKDELGVEKSAETIVLPGKKFSSESVSTESAAVNSLENKNFFNVQSLPYLGIENANNVISRSVVGSTTEHIQNRQLDVSTANSLYQLDNVDIPASVMEILSQHKFDVKKPTDATTTLPTSAAAAETLKYNLATVNSNDETDSLKIDLTKVVSNENVPNAVESSATIKTAGVNFKKLALPQRPMRLIGLSPIYVDNSQLQTLTDNLTAVSPIHLEPFVNIQYATPTPFFTGPLLGGPAPFRNIPRSVSDANTDMLVSSIPIVSSVPISAPIISQQLTPPQSGDATKQDLKIESNKPMTPPASLPLCSDCLLPPNYLPYPMMKMPSTNNGNHQKPCSSSSSNNVPYWAPYTPSLAYILMPTQIIKNKANEHRAMSTTATR